MGKGIEVRRNEDRRRDGRRDEEGAEEWERGKRAEECHGRGRKVEGMRIGEGMGGGRLKGWERQRRKGENVQVLPIEVFCALNRNGVGSRF